MTILMAPHLALFFLLTSMFPSFEFTPATSELVVSIAECTSPNAKGWKWSGSGQIMVPSPGNDGTTLTNVCLDAVAPPAHEQLIVRPCGTGLSIPTTQIWKAVNVTVKNGLSFPSLALANVPGDWGPAILQGDVLPGHPAILYSLSMESGFCFQHRSCDFTYDHVAMSFVHPDNAALCLGVSSGPPPPPPPPPPSQPTLEYSCTKGQPLATTPTCIRSLGFKARAADLASRLNLSDHVNLFFSYPGTPFIPSLNVKGWSLDHTCIHGLNKLRNVSLFPHEIAQGSSWDMDLVHRILNATATEARIVSAKAYVKSKGMSLGSVLSCDGGPAAAQAHDPRWGRVSWTWGEDAFHIKQMGQAAYVGLQSPRQVVGGADDDVFLATRATVPYYLAYYGGTGDPQGYGSAFNATALTLRQLLDRLRGSAVQVCTKPSRRCDVCGEHVERGALVCGLVVVDNDVARAVAVGGDHPNRLLRLAGLCRILQEDQTRRRITRVLGCWWWCLLWFRCRRVQISHARWLSKQHNRRSRSDRDWYACARD